MKNFLNPIVLVLSVHLAGSGYLAAQDPVEQPLPSVKQPSSVVQEPIPDRVDPQNKVLVVQSTITQPSLLPAGSTSRGTSCNTCGAVEIEEDDSSTCEAQFDGAYWNVTSNCAGNCRCMTPSLSSRFPLPPVGATTSQVGTFGCDDKLFDATADRFFLNLSGEGTYSHKLGFDKSNVDMFSAFKIQVKQPDPSNSKILWRIDATLTNNWVDAGVLDTTMNCNSAHKACAVITCDSRKFGDQSFTGTFQPNVAQTLLFGNWKVEITYLPNP